MIIISSLLCSSCCILLEIYMQAHCCKRTAEVPTPVILSHFKLLCSFLKRLSLFQASLLTLSMEAWFLERSGKGAGSKKHKKNVSPGIISSLSYFWPPTEHGCPSFPVASHLQHASVYDSCILLFPIFHEFFLTYSPVHFTNSCHIFKVICTEVLFQYTFQKCILLKEQPYRPTICWPFNSGTSCEDGRTSGASGLQAFSFESLWPRTGYKENPWKFFQNYSTLPKVNQNDPQKLNGVPANTEKKKYNVPSVATSQYTSYRPLISDVKQLNLSQCRHIPAASPAFPMLAISLISCTEISIRQRFRPLRSCLAAICASCCIL